MNFSAAWSSSAVVTPGRIFPASRLMVLTRIAPAAAIRSISCGVFLMITSDVLFEAKGGDHRPDVIVYFGRRPRAIDPAHKALLVVVVDQRRGLLVVDPQPILDHVGLVIVTLNESRAVLVADAVVLGRIELQVVVVAGLHTYATAGQAANDLLVRHVDQQGSSDAPAHVRKLLAQRVGLSDRAGKAV